MDPGDADREELAERVAELEEQNEALQEETEQHRHWLKKMMPDRRGVLKGLGAAALGGAAVGGATGGASGQSAAGQVGTESAPVDVEGAQGNFDSVNTEVSTTKSNPVYNVTHPDFGAVGDGSADDTAAIEAALSAANNNGGGTVYLPAGNYRITSTIQLPDQYVNIIGDGMFTSVIEADGISALANDLGPTDAYYRDFGVVDTQNAAETIGIELTRPFNATISRVRCKSFGETGLRQIKGVGSTYQWCYFEQNGTNTTGTGRTLHVTDEDSSGTNATTVTLREIYAAGGGQRGIDIDNTQSVYMERNIVENHTVAFRFESMSGIALWNYEESNSDSDPVQIWNCNPIWVGGRGADPTAMDLTNLSPEKRYPPNWGVFDFSIRDFITQRFYKYEQHNSDPDTSTLADGEVALYVSMGNSAATGNAGDLVYAINDAGTIKTQVIAAASNAT